jgi:predicted Zn-dependent peptidase
MKKKTTQRNKKSDSVNIQFDVNNLYRKTVLNSGLTVISEQVPDSPYFALGFCVKSGSANDKKGAEGTAHFMEHIAFRRTKHYTGKRLVNEFESIGAYVNAYTTKEMTCFYVLALNDKIGKCLKLLNEVVLYPKFNEKDIEKEKNIILEEITSYEDDPEELIFDLGEQIMFEKSAYEHPIVGYAGALRDIGQQELAEFHSANYILNNMILSYSGPANHFDLLELIDNSLNAVADRREISDISLPKQIASRKVVFNKNFQQSHILFIARTGGLSSSERYIYAVISNILGEGLSSRFNQILREKYGYVYSVYSTLALLRDLGSISIYAAVDNSNLKNVESLITDELNKIYDKGFTAKEIKSAKEQIKSSTIIGLDGVSAKMQSLARIEAVGGSYETIKETISLIDNVNADDINKVLRKNLVPENWNEVVLNGIK